MSIASRRLLLLLTLFSLAACRERVAKPVSPAKAEIKHVALLNLGPHPLMQTIAAETAAALNASGTIRVRTYDANFQQELLLKSARDMVASDASVLIAVTTPAAQTLLAENRDRKPVVFTFVSTPSELGINLAARKQVTGIVDTLPIEENLELIKSSIGKEHVTIGYVVNDGEASARKTFDDVQRIAGRFGISITKIAIGTATDVRPSAALMVKRVDAFLVGPDTVATTAIDGLLLAAGKIPTFCMDPASVEKGCVAAIAPDYAGMGRKTAEYVRLILEGQTPSALPIVEFRSTVIYGNRSKAESLGITIPSKNIRWVR